MNTKVFSLFVFMVYMPLAGTLYAQNVYQLGGLPSLNLNRALKNNWSLNAKIESRQQLKSGDFGESEDTKYSYLLTDFSVIAAKKVGLNSRIAGGYLIRDESGNYFHRFIQHYIILQRLYGLRLAHRFLCDQTFSEIEKNQFRIRYRFTSELPLSGESVDPKEFYLKFNNEYLNAFQAGAYDLEIRIVPLIGYDLSESFKIETGLDYRVNSFTSNKPTEHSLWMSLNLYVEI